jgi:hypothetical protein
MTITTNPVRNQYDAISGQTVFNYTFKIYSSTDLNVYLTPVGQVPDDSTDLITSYVVDPGTIENEDGGFLTLNTGAAAGDTLTIVSSIPYNRETDYQFNGDFRPATVNNDIDRVVSLVKQNAGDLLRAVLAPESSDLENPIRIPSPENGKGLKWENNNLANTAIVETVTTGTSGTELITVSGNDVSVKGLAGSASILLTDLGDTIRIDAISPAGGNVRTNGDNTYNSGTTQTMPRLIILGVNIGEELLAQGVIQAQLAIDVQSNAASAQAAQSTATTAINTANSANSAAQAAQTTANGKISQSQGDARYTRKGQSRNTLANFTVSANGGNSREPTGWVTSQISPGVYQVTHNENSILYPVITAASTSVDDSYNTHVFDNTANSFKYVTRNISGTPVSLAHYIMLTY